MTQEGNGNWEIEVSMTSGRKIKVYQDIDLTSPVVNDPELPDDSEPQEVLEMLEELEEYLQFAEYLAASSKRNRKQDFIDWKYVHNEIIKLPFIPKTKQHEEALTVHWVENLQAKAWHLINEANYDPE